MRHIVVLETLKELKRSEILNGIILMCCIQVLYLNANCDLSFVGFLFLLVVHLHAILILLYFLNNVMQFRTNSHFNS